MDIHKFNQEKKRKKQKMAQLMKYFRRDGIRWNVRLTRWHNGKHETVDVSFKDREMALNFIQTEEKKFKAGGVTAIEIPHPRERGIKTSHTQK